MGRFFSLLPTKSHGKIKKFCKVRWTQNSTIPPAIFSVYNSFHDEVLEIEEKLKL